MPDRWERYKSAMEVSLLPHGSFTPPARARASAPELPPTARFARAERSQSQAEEKRTLGACDASQEREGQMDRGGQAPRPAKHIKHTEMALVGLAGHFWPISNTPLISQPLCCLIRSSSITRHRLLSTSTRRIIRSAGGGQHIKVRPSNLIPHGMLI
jgi:hypothetical protein